MSREPSDRDPEVRGKEPGKETRERDTNGVSMHRFRKAVNALTRCNRAAARAGEESAFLKRICEIMVEDGDYRFAWVGVPARDEKKGISSVACSGREDEYSGLFQSERADAGEGVSPMSTAIRTGRPCACASIASESRYQRWRTEAVKRGFGSCVTLPLTSGGEVFGALELYSEEQDAFDREELNLLDELVEDIGFSIAALRDRAQRKLAEEEVASSLRKLRKATLGIIQAMSLTVERRDPYTSGHQRRVADLGRAIATEMGLSPDQIDGIRTAAVIHDLGKIAVPAEILSKPGRLTEHEFAIIKDHAQAGRDILSEMEFPWPVAEIIHQHHERMDGSGYPRSLSGEEILVEARVLAIADVVEAMSSHRPYRPGLGIERALEEIVKNRGIFYYPEAVDACVRLFREKGYQYRAL